MVLHEVNVHINSDAYNWDIWEAGNVDLLQAEIYEGTTVEDEIIFDFNTPVVTSEQVSIDSSFADKWALIEFMADGGVNAITPPTNCTQYFVLLRMYTNNLRFFLLVPTNSARPVFIPTGYVWEIRLAGR